MPPQMTVRIGQPKVSIRPGNPDDPSAFPHNCNDPDEDDPLCVEKGKPCHFHAGTSCWCQDVIQSGGA